MAMSVKITRDLLTLTSCIDLSVRIVVKYLKVEPLLRYSHLSGSTFSILFLPAPYHVLSTRKLEAEWMI
jgi:hypothetical protein